MPNKQTSISVALLTISLCLCSLLVFPAILDLSLHPRFILLSLCLIAFTAWRMKHSHQLTIQLNILNTTYTAFVLWSCLSIVWAQNKAEAINDSAKWVVGLGVFTVATYFLEQQAKKFKTALFHAAAFVSVLLFLVVSLQALSLQSYSHQNIYAIVGLNGHKNLLASILFLLLFFIGMYSEVPRAYAKPLALGLLALNIGTIIFLQTKAVWLALMVLATLHLLNFVSGKNRSLSKPKLFFVPVLLMLLLNLFFLRALPPLTKHFATKPSQKSGKFYTFIDQERLMVWNKTTQLIEANPFIGVGSGNWQVYFPSTTLSGIWRSEDLNVSFQRPHNDLLWILSETGVIGFNFYFLFICGILVFGFATKPQTLTTRKVFPSGPLFVLAFLVIAFFDFPKERAEHMLWWNLLLATVYHDVRKHKIIASYGSFSFSVFLPAIIISASVFAVFTWRCRGEYFTRKMYDAKALGNTMALIENGKKAQSVVYTLDPTSVPIDWYIGNAYSILKQFQTANTFFLSAYANNPFQRNVLNDLASSYVMQGNNQAAIPLYVEAARISPRFDDPKLNLAAIYLTDKNLPMAKQYLDSIYHESERRSKYREILHILESESK